MWLDWKGKVHVVAVFVVMATGMLGLVPAIACTQRTAWAVAALDADSDTVVPAANLARAAKAVSLLRQTIALRVVHTAFLVINSAYFILSSFSPDRAFMQSGLSVALSTLVLALVLQAETGRRESLGLLDTMREAQTDEQRSADLRGVSDLLLLRGYYEAGLAMTIAMWAAQMVVAMLWVCLLPRRHRPPNRYMPIVRRSRGRPSRWLGIGAPDRPRTVTALGMGVSSEVGDTGPLLQLFREHEETQAGGPNTKGVATAADEPLLRSPRRPRASSQERKGPQLNPATRYWALNRRSAAISHDLIHGSAIVGLVLLPWELTMVILRKRETNDCDWACQGAPAMPCLWILVAIVFVVLVRLRITLPSTINILERTLKLEVVMAVAVTACHCVFACIQVARCIYILTIWVSVSLKFPAALAALLSAVAELSRFGYILWAIV